MNTFEMMICQWSNEGTDEEINDNLTFPLSIDPEDFYGITLDDVINDKMHPLNTEWPNDIYHEFMEIVMEYQLSNSCRDRLIKLINNCRNFTDENLLPINTKEGQKFLDFNKFPYIKFKTVSITNFEKLMANNLKAIDSTTYDHFGKISEYPIYILLGNIPSWQQNKHNSNVLINYLPKLKAKDNTTKNSESFQKLQRQATVPDQMHVLDLKITKYLLEFTQKYLQQKVSIKAVKKIDHRLYNLYENYKEEGVPCERLCNIFYLYLMIYMKLHCESYTDMELVELQTSITEFCQEFVNIFFEYSSNKYQEFCNAYAYYKQVVLCNSKPNRQKLMQECITAWKEVREQNTSFIENKINEYYNTIPPTIHSHQKFFLSHHTPRTPTASTSTPTPPKHTSIPQRITTSRPIINEFIDTTTIPTNARSQQNAANKINSALKNISECQQMVEITTDESLKVTLKTKIIEEQNNLSE
ncbi:hypothetical protein C1646_762500 [Rhizophagus diaphanus]|nr:hypothetical protein C1646_762500 [Rhizophagus diaphanus] [Rhizophagus sp. MUCL 43196]